MLDDVLSTVAARHDASLSALKEWLAIPSVSAQPDHKADMMRAAQWLADQLKFAELETSIMPTPGHPIVVAKNKHVPGRPTVLFYGHYDVQPAEPLELWETPAFEPTVRDGKLFARGASDDKGQVWCHVAAIQAWQAHGGVPVNLTVLVEGEEEVASANLEGFLRSYAEDLRADVALISDTGMFDADTPAITTGLRGLMYAEVTVQGAKSDLHSGLYGGAVPNPCNVLCQLLGSLKDADNRVTIPGFYDDVQEPAADELAAWSKLDRSDEALANELGLKKLDGEAGRSTLERLWSRPTCDVNGILGGYTGEGAKTVLPSKAMGKVSFRLVPAQDPKKIQAAFEQQLRAQAPDSVELSFRYFGAEPAALTPADSPAMTLARQAVEIGFGKEPALICGGGSIPVVGLLKQQLGLDTLLVGFGLGDDNLHAPNEKFDLVQLQNGTATAAALYGKLADLPMK
ncbi:MAG: dipeptidase [Planctomycetota bacterium]